MSKVKSRKAILLPSEIVFFSSLFSMCIYDCRLEIRGARLHRINTETRARIYFKLSDWSKTSEENAV